MSTEPSVAGPPGHPFHPLLVTVPIGAWACSVAFDVASRTSHETVWGRGAMWLVTLGLAGAVVAGVVGFLDFRALPAGSAARRLATMHGRLNGLGSALFAASLVVRRMRLDSLAKGSPILAIVLSVAGFLLIMVSGWWGNALVFTMGARGLATPTGAEPETVAGPEMAADAATPSARTLERRPEAKREAHPAVRAARERRQAETDTDPDD